MQPVFIKQSVNWHCVTVCVYADCNRRISRSMGRLIFFALLNAKSLMGEYKKHYRQTCLCKTHCLSFAEDKICSTFSVPQMAKKSRVKQCYDKTVKACLCVWKIYLFPKILTSACVDEIIDEKHVCVNFTNASAFFIPPCCLVCDNFCFTIVMPVIKYRTII